jgi:3-phosphoshikimate 1-carboxyvinyltransferase
MLIIEPIKLSKPVEWSLPPSKSHMIRWLAVASQSKEESIIKFSGKPGNDIISMMKCIKKFGVEITELESMWKVKGIDFDEADIKNINLYCGNSGTTTNFMAVMASSFDAEVIIDGDESLRNRDFSEINNALRRMGAKITSNNPPFILKGPVKFDRVSINTQKSSQPLSSLIIAFNKNYKNFTIECQGKPVSRDYIELTIDIAKKCGTMISKNDNCVTLNCDEIILPETIIIPQEISLLPISILLSELHGVEFKIADLEKSFFLKDSIRMIKKIDEKILNLRDCSDFITPAAAILAIREGGKIIGAGHAKGKESDRIEKTAELLKVFGLDCEIIEEGLVIKGGQIPIRPKKTVKTYFDHRMAMTAVALATYSGGEIDNPEISEITDPTFIEKILALKK